MVGAIITSRVVQVSIPCIVAGLELEEAMILEGRVGSDIDEALRS